MKLKAVLGQGDEPALEPMDYQDRRLAGLHAPTCVSCLKRPAVISRRFANGEIFLVCWDCR